MINLEDYRMTDASGIGIYVGTYKKYNDGNLFGMWIDLESIRDEGEFFDVCRELHKDEESPEYMMQDFQNFPEELYSESMNEEDIAKVLAYVALDDDDREMMDDYCECYGHKITDVIDTTEAVRGRCMGCYDSFQQFADEMADEQMDCCGDVPEFLRNYFDYEAFARDLKYDYSVGSNGYIFNDNY